MDEDSFEYVRSTLESSLTSFGFAMIDEQFDPARFGNAIVTFRSSDLLLRLVRDRGQLFIELASTRHPQEWHELTTLLRFSGITSAPKTAVVDADRLTLLAIDSFEPITTALSEEQRPALHRFKRAESVERFES